MFRDCFTSVAFGKVCTAINGVRHWLWMGVDEQGFVLDQVKATQPS